MQEERLNIELPVVEQKLGQLEMTGNEPKGEAVLNPIGTKLDTSDFDLAGDIAHGNNKYMFLVCVLYACIACILFTYLCLYVCLFMCIAILCVYAYKCLYSLMYTYICIILF